MARLILRVTTGLPAASRNAGLLFSIFLCHSAVHSLVPLYDKERIRKLSLDAVE